MKKKQDNKAAFDKKMAAAKKRSEAAKKKADAADAAYRKVRREAKEKEAARKQAKFEREYQAGKERIVRARGANTTKADWVKVVKGTTKALSKTSKPRRKKKAKRKTGMGPHP